MRIVIIEDEKLTAVDLMRTIMAIEPNVEIAAILHSVEEGMSFFENQKDVDLIFSDIQLGDGLSFEILKSLTTPVPVIFCTAYDSYLFQAFQSAGIDYVLKPFTKVSIQQALEKYQNLKKRFSQNRNDYSNVLQLLETKLKPVKSAVIIRHRDKIIPLDVAAVALFFVSSSGTHAYTFKQETFLVSENLEELEFSFMPQFFRANRQFLVNRKAVKDAAQHFNRKIAVNLTIPYKETILVGKLKTTAFVEWLKG